MATKRGPMLEKEAIVQLAARGIDYDFCRGLKLVHPRAEWSQGKVIRVVSYASVQRLLEAGPDGIVGLLEKKARQATERAAKKRAKARAQRKAILTARQQVLQSELVEIDKELAELEDGYEPSK